MVLVFAFTKVGEKGRFKTTLAYVPLQGFPAKINLHKCMHIYTQFFTRLQTYPVYQKLNLIISHLLVTDSRKLHTKLEMKCDKECQDPGSCFEGF